MDTCHRRVRIPGDGSHAEVYLHVTPDKKMIVSIPGIHWSAQFNRNTDLTTQTEHLKFSLQFHLFEGNTDELVFAITNLASKYF
ncbi:YueH family protein [Sporosarcina globispora]|uniref:YueH family protein n=1 Tax=Sporosarcina globispora TaxID=1459 RepID=UPI0009EA8CF3|nr:YueH family protein [Sporosarcina globispora]